MVTGIQRDRYRAAIDTATKKLESLTQTVIMEATGMAIQPSGSSAQGNSNGISNAIADSIAQLKYLSAQCPNSGMSGHVAYIMMNVRKLMQSGEPEAAHILLVGLCSQLSEAARTAASRYVFNPTEI